jgi:lipid A 3-O-deacylase
MMRKFGYLIFMTALFLISLPMNTYGYPSEAKEGLTAEKTEFEMEYLVPTGERRDIDTISLNIFKEVRNNGRVAFYNGITLTHAWGDMTQSGVKSDCAAYGIGPTYLVRIGVKEWDNAAFSFDMSGALIFYDKDFPNNGDFYNFMWRIGPKFSYRIAEYMILNIGYILMHVSNGQLYWPELTGTAHNPAYNAKGLSLTVVYCF